MTSETPLITVERASYRYPTARDDDPDLPAVDDVSLAVRPGEYVALLGPNGSGKSTLGRLMSGLLRPASGRVLVEGADTRLAAGQARVRAAVGIIFSDPDTQIVAPLVEDDVAWGLAAQGMPRAQIDQRVAAALAATGLEGARGRAPHELSGGQRQRLAVAGALAGLPRCLIADEPTALLDPLARRDLSRLLLRLRDERGLAVIHITHLLEEAADADRVVVLQAGRVALDGPLAPVFADLGRLAALGLVVPQVARLGERLRALGAPVSGEALTPEALAAGLEGWR